MSPPTPRLYAASAALLGLLLVSCTGETDLPNARPEEPASLEPYAFTAAPPREPTEIDGTYLRATEGQDAVPCRRCAPYRLEAGASTLELDQGRFRIVHEPPTRSSSGFRSVGHYEVAGQEITFFNDPNCTKERGRYRWRIEDDQLILETLRDECFMGLRSEYLTYDAWSAE